jgi:ubiquinol oxidase
MHLIICLNKFHAKPFTRLIVLCAQYVMIPTMMSVYLVHPKALHRFVGYLEETACHTYVNIIKHIEKPGTHLNREWGEMPAPAIGIGYYKLSRDAKWVDCLKCMVR